jgi:hypothetical protein
VIGDRCYVTVLLDEEAWQSLAALSSEHDAAWVHRCVLERGHRGEHLAEPSGAGPLRCWVQWREGGRARVSTTRPPLPPAPDIASAVEQPGWEPQPHRLTTASHSTTRASERLEAPTPESEAEALWAIAAALQHLADVIAAALSAANEDTGRHRRQAAHDDFG